MVRRLLLALLCAALLGSGAWAQEFELVRLHVEAQDDSPRAQALKRELRDVCLRCAEVCIGDAGSAREAYDRLAAHAGDFRSACEARARELGCGAQISASVGVYPFPDRLYGDVLLPAGDYPALRVTIGGGGGHNWWCVLYPTLCAVNEEHAAGVENVPGVLAWLRDRFGGAA